MEILGTIGFLVLVFLPGAWITFGLPLTDLPLWARFLTGTMLAPVIVGLQFHPIRLLGASFELTVILLVVFNLPALCLIAKQLDNTSFPDRRTVVGCLLVLLVPFVFLALQFVDPQVRAYSGHAWMHTDTIYMLANGELLPGEPELAGVTLGYPWAGHIHQAILSYLLGSPPVSNYFWTNMFWLLFIWGFAAGIVAELGGDRFSRISSAIWLFFGVNFLGYVLGHAIPRTFAHDYPIWGDYRYTPWLLKFFFFSQMPFALGIFIAIVYLMIRQPSNGSKNHYLAVVGLLLCGIGVIYPLLFAPAAAVVGARVIAMLFDRSPDRQAVPYKHIVGLGIVLVIAGLVTFAYLKLVTQDRVSNPMLQFSTWWDMKRKATESVVVTFPLLVGLTLVSPRSWKTKRSATIVLVLGALVSCMLYVMFHIPHWRNEYKFIFTAAVCLAPFPSLAMEPVINRLNRRTLPVFGVIILILAAPFAHKMYNDWPWVPKNRPLLDMRTFDVRLDKKERLSRMYDAIREGTPTNSILIMENAELHFPTLTRRSLYVAPAQKRPHPGINLQSDQIFTVRGYNKDIIQERRLTLRALFESDDQRRRTLALNRIMELNRPVTIIVDTQRHAALLDWLRNERKGEAVYKGDGFIVWLVEPGFG